MFPRVRAFIYFIAAFSVSSAAVAKKSNSTATLQPSLKVASSNTTVTATPTSTTPTTVPKESTVSGSLNISRSTSLYDYQDGTRKDNLDYEGRLNIKLNEKYSILFIGGYAQNLKNSEGDDFTDTAVVASRKPQEIGKIILLGYGFSTLLATSKDTYKNKGHLGSIGGSLSAEINKSRLINGLSISGSVSLARNFHEYETARDGKVNTQYSSKQSFSVGYDLGSGFSISGLFIHRNTWSYQNVMRDTYETYEEIGYQFNPTFAFAIGHTNSGSSLKPNGIDSNVQLYDENNSLVYISSTLSF